MFCVPVQYADGTTTDGCGFGLFMLAILVAIAVAAFIASKGD
jgi:hypothetical protein